MKSDQKIKELKENQNELKDKIQQDKLIDFGLSCFFHENGSLSKYYSLKDNLNFVDTFRYVSLN